MQTVRFLQEMLLVASRSIRVTAVLFTISKHSCICVFLYFQFLPNIHTLKEDTI